MAGVCCPCPADRPACPQLKADTSKARLPGAQEEWALRVAGGLHTRQEHAARTKGAHGPQRNGNIFPNHTRLPKQGAKVDPKRNEALPTRDPQDLEPPGRQRSDRRTRDTLGNQLSAWGPRRGSRTRGAGGPRNARSSRDPSHPAWPETTPGNPSDSSPAAIGQRLHLLTPPRREATELLPDLTPAPLPRGARRGPRVRRGEGTPASAPSSPAPPAAGPARVPAVPCSEGAETKRPRRRRGSPTALRSLLPGRLSAAPAPSVRSAGPRGRRRRLPGSKTRAARAGGSSSLRAAAVTDGGCSRGGAHPASPPPSLPRLPGFLRAR
ncbi:translation initiation factor IF-2-like [Equus quagga]|uniref:translation initiation factor IF-2-like n=1 Tax=Equus quagga TaxID=89248 RepID=UPI001EE19FCF|nr:translation initiation factor IF-2-like [Equus quagga]